MISRGALIRAVDSTNFNEMVSLVEQGADVNERNAAGYTPLSLAIAQNKLDFAEYLAEKGATLKGQKSFGILLMAVHLKQLSAVRLMLRCDIDVNEKGFRGDTAIILAADHGHHHILRALIDKGADLDAKSRSGKTALDVAKEKSCPVTIRILEEAAAEKVRKIERRKKCIRAATVLQHPLPYKKSPFRVKGRNP